MLFRSITICDSFQKAQECEMGEAAFAESVLYEEELAEFQNEVDAGGMPATRKQVSDQAPTFKAANDTKTVELVEGDASKTTSIGSHLFEK